MEIPMVFRLILEPEPQAHYICQSPHH